MPPFHGFFPCNWPVDLEPLPDPKEWNVFRLQGLDPDTNGVDPSHLRGFRASRLACQGQQFNGPHAGIGPPPIIREDHMRLQPCLRPTCVCSIAHGRGRRSHSRGGPPPLEPRGRRRSHSRAPDATMFAGRTIAQPAPQESRGRRRSHSRAPDATMFAGRPIAHDQPAPPESRGRRRSHSRAPDATMFAGRTIAQPAPPEPHRRRKSHSRAPDATMFAGRPMAHDQPAPPEPHRRRRSHSRAPPDATLFAGRPIAPAAPAGHGFGEKPMHSGRPPRDLNFGGRTSHGGGGRGPPSPSGVPHHSHRGGRAGGRDRVHPLRVGSRASGMPGEKEEEEEEGRRMARGGRRG
ncbi:hypothetical protein MMC20_001154 [Loxospora ochrophaea]|nr:hypothetical protein [Loxospora ochrophaea]